MSMVMQRVRNEGIAEGRTAGIAEGRAETYGMLRELAAEGRQSDIMRAISDESYFRELMRAHRGNAAQ